MMMTPRRCRVLYTNKKITLTAIVLMITVYIFIASRRKPLVKPLVNPPAWGSNTVNAGLLRVMNYIEKERGLDNTVRDAFVNKIWQGVKNDLTSQLLHQLKPNEIVELIGVLKYHNKSETVDKLQQILEIVNDQLVPDIPQTFSSLSSLSSSLSSKHPSSLRIDRRSFMPSFNQTDAPIVDASDSLNWKNARIPNFTSIHLKPVLSNPVINSFDITYNYINPAVCKTNNIKYLIVIPSAIGNFERREKIRKSERAIFASNPKNKARLIFFTGMPNKTAHNLHSKLEQERLKFGDIVQATFIDSYKNISKKTAMMFDWSAKYCSRAKFLIRTDDDVDVNVSSMISSLELQNSKFSHFILGKRATQLYPERRIYSKWSKYFIPFEQWPYKTLPPYLFGGAYGCPIKTVGLLIEAMRRVPLFWLDDVFVTGICAKLLGIPIFHNKSFEFKHGDQ